jgi:cation transport ATPase
MKGNIEENLPFASIRSVLGVPIATVKFYPFFGILLRPTIAATAMNFSLVSVF